MSSFETGGAIVALGKFLPFGAAALGAILMAVFRPPKTRREMALQALVALGGSMLFGGLGVSLMAAWTGVAAETLIVPVHGLIGALSWGFFGGLAHWRDVKLSKDLVGSLKEAKDVLKP